MSTTTSTLGCVSSRYCPRVRSPAAYGMPRVRRSPEFKFRIHFGPDNCARLGFGSQIGMLRHDLAKALSKSAR